jgi:DNA-directed RNA polymerase sigma subunit (sigma70/sigma32)
MRKNLKYTFKRIGQEFDISKARARQLYVRIVEERSKDVSRKMGIGA